MYETHFGLLRRPFALAPDPEFLFWTKQHRLAATMLELGVERQSPITLVTGAVGTGKTLLIRHFLSTAPGELTIGLLSNFLGSHDEIYKWILMAFGQPHAGVDRPTLLIRLQEFLLGEYAKGRRSVLIVDEAQSVSDAEIETLRLLTNINSGKDTVLMLILVGQPQLRERLQRHEYRQIMQRVGASFHLETMDAEETRGYVAHRVAVAGGRADLFEPEAADVLHAAAEGVPRVVNTLCEMCLVTAFGVDRERIDRAFAESVVEEARANHAVALPVRGEAEVVTALERRRRAGRGDVVVPLVKRSVREVPLQPPRDEPPEAPVTRLPERPAEAPAPAELRLEDDGGFRLREALAGAEALGEAEAEGRPGLATAAEPGGASTPLPAAALPLAALPRQRGGAGHVAGFFDLALTGGLVAAVSALALLALAPGGAGPVIDAAAVAPAATPAEAPDAAPEAEVARAAEVVAPVEPVEEAAAEVAAQVEPVAAARPALEGLAPLGPGERAAAAAGAAVEPGELYRAALGLAPADPEAASVLLARAAAGGHARAAYFLAQMYETGDGVAYDLALARAWYGLARTDRAAARLADLPAPEASGALAAPVPLAAMAEPGGGASLVWTSGPGRDPQTYTVETAAGPDAAANPAAKVAISTARLTAAPEARVWRVRARDAAGEEAVSAWAPLP